MAFHYFCPCQQCFESIADIHFYFDCLHLTRNVDVSKNEKFHLFIRDSVQLVATLTSIDPLSLVCRKKTRSGVPPDVKVAVDRSELH